jgi:predicted flavoprotein YhiN
VRVAPLTAANCGWELDWPPAVLEEAEGRPLKNIAASAGESVAIGELLVTRYGLEGGIIYQLGPALRAMAEPRITIDFKPGSTIDRLVARMGAPGRNLFEEACRRWRLDVAMSAILEHHPERRAWNSVETLAAAVKACPLRLRGPRPLAEAISSAGGIEWSEIDSSLMLRKLPGVFVAGEMIDWDAPTGGYLMQGCFSTATRAGRGALLWTGKMTKSE